MYVYVNVQNCGDICERKKTVEIRPIAKARTGYTSKFGIPRQSRVVEEAVSRIVFEPEFRNRDALRGLDGFSHIWLIWEFSEGKDDSSENSSWSPTVRPPRLGGNTRLGVFATRSPFRPNRLGISAVKLISIDDDTAEGPVLVVGGADLLDGTPIYDIKPYIPYADSIPDALGGFTDSTDKRKLKVEDPERMLERLGAEKPKLRKETSECLNEKGKGSEGKQTSVSDIQTSAPDIQTAVPDIQTAVRRIIEEDPRPAYQNKDGRIYGMNYAGYEIKFRTEGDTAVITYAGRPDR